MAGMREIDFFVTIINQYKILETVALGKNGKWEQVWQEFDGIIASAVFESEAEKQIYTDLFFHQCLVVICPIRQSREFFTIIEKWYKCRKPQNRCGNLSNDVKIALVHFVIKMRFYLFEFFTKTNLGRDVWELTEKQERLLTAVWRQVFFEPFSALCLYWNPSSQERQLLLEKCQNSGYGGLMAASMYQPFAAGDYQMDPKEMLSADIPRCWKMILMIWMVNTPYFHAEERHREKIIRYIPALCRELMQSRNMIDTFFFFTFVQEVMTALWRASYIGGNNLPALCAFGDFIAFVMQRSFPIRLPRVVKNEITGREKIRIGYISRNFYKQAVSCYMVNRVIHHNRDQFEVFVFALGEYHDEISELFKENSVHFERIGNLTDLRAMIEAVQAQNLDILIYTDIGMDSSTFMLSGLQLAPVQCALVGHGTSTGMPTIQYYLSGDFEVAEAQSHYREKLIRLPRLGAAQYMPLKKKKYLSREQLGIPRDAVVFISCANGLKHGKDRYSVFIDILVKAPNAWILLKPYAQAASIDYHFAGEIIALAVQAGVAGRLKLLPPIGDACQVLGLLSIADVQLDSYPYGGWTTNMEALYMGLPIVTQEGDQARSRWGAGMLKALGINAGIAANAGEYVECAVRLAQDPLLRQEIKKKIRRKAKKVLFNGPAAQKAYEQTIIEIYQEQCTVTAQRQSEDEISSEMPVIVTSLSPADLEKQLAAIETWQQDGFKVVSINAMDEIAAIRPYAANLEFIVADRDARSKYNKPLIYINDIMDYFKNRPIRCCGIVNADIYLCRPNFSEFVCRESKNSFLYGSRLEVKSLNSEQGHEYRQGFDYFFFDRSILKCFPEKQEFCLGLPWWDYWLVIVPLMHKVSVKKIASPVGVHIAHETKWKLENWLEMGIAMARNFKPPFSLSHENMLKYAEETLTIIRKLSQEIAL
jgi:hypothetical protein